MSIVVLGMEMPTTCVDCELYHNGWEYGDYGSCEAHKVIFGEEDDWKYETRPNWCPLRPLPEKHGRLADVDALDTAFTGFRFNDDGTLRHWDDRKNWCLHGSEVENLITDAPTIVEAEGKYDD